jgi:hypothetical protein
MEAERFYREITPDLDAYMEQMTARIVELGGSKGRALLEAHLGEILADFKGGPYPEGLAAAMRGFLDEPAEEIRSALIELGTDPGRLESIWTTNTVQAHAVTGTRKFSDGSALIWISHSLVELTNVILAYFGREFYLLSNQSLVRRTWKLARLEAEQRFLGHTPTLIGLIRYSLLGRRCLGEPGVIAMRRNHNDDLVEELAYYALQFIIGHEMAHHALGHPAAVHGIASDRLIPACSPSQDRELEADRLGFRAAMLAAVKQNGPLRRLRPDWAVESSVLIGACAALLAIHAEEQGLFVRSGHTHPTAAQRIESLCAESGQMAADVAEMMVPEALFAIERASDFSHTGKPYRWSQLNKRRYPLLQKRQPWSWNVTLMDRAQCHKQWRLVRGLMIFPACVEGATRLDNGDVQGALRAWGVDADEAAEICDAESVLTFHQVVESVSAGLEPAGMKRGTRMLAALQAARLVEIELAGL